MSDAEYQKFVSFLSKKDVSYSTSVEQAIDELVKKAQAEKHYDDVKAEIEQLRKKVSHNKANDLNRFKPEIKELLEQEIALRYYFQKGAIEASFDDDEDILAAIKVLNNPQQYQSLLQASAKK